MEILLNNQLEELHCGCFYMVYGHFCPAMSRELCLLVNFETFFMILFSFKCTFSLQIF